MKKIIFLSFMMLSAGVCFGASEDTLAERSFESYSDTDNVASIEITLSGTPGVISTVTVPSNAKGFRLYPRSNHIRFSVDYQNVSNSIAAVATSSALTIVSTNTARGGIAKNDIWETRLLPAVDKKPRYLLLRSTTASVVVDLEFF